MRLITNVEIADFRSIQSATLKLGSGFVPIVGQNNSGKSNILRALHLFFTGDVEPGVALNLARDFHNPGRKRRREISVGVTFDLPEYFRFHKQIREGLDQTLGRRFSIRKSWSYAGQESPDELAMRITIQKHGEPERSAEGDDTHRVAQFLKLVRFRYQPNHIHPSEMLKNEEPELQRVLLYYLRKKKLVGSKEFDQIFEHMTDVASELVAPIRDSLRNTSSHVQDLELTTPKELGELLFTFFPKLSVSGGTQLDALQHGSGVQSFLTVLMLHFLDTRFQMDFGWRQATVWALEEPESFLHQSLQHSVAEFLKSSGAGERFQVLATTHSDVFPRYGETGVLCRLRSGRTDWIEVPSRVLVGEAAKSGITAYVHPLLFAAQRPLLLVEGKTDLQYLRLAYRLIGKLNPWLILDIPALDPDLDLEGVDGLRTYLSGNRSALRTRALHAPVFVLVDWSESPKKCKSLEKELACHATSRVIRWQSSDMNPDLDQTFAGIERALGTSLIKAGEQNGLLRAFRPSSAEVPLRVDRGSLKKSQIVELAQSRSEPEDFAYFRLLLDRLEGDLRQALEKADQVVSGELFPVADDGFQGWT